jgi:hypothetical protein
LSADFDDITNRTLRFTRDSNIKPILFGVNTETSDYTDTINMGWQAGNCAYIAFLAYDPAPVFTFGFGQRSPGNYLRAYFYGNDSGTNPRGLIASGGSFRPGLAYYGIPMTNQPILQNWTAGGIPLVEIWAVCRSVDGNYANIEWWIRAQGLPQSYGSDGPVCINREIVDISDPANQANWTLRMRNYESGTENLFISRLGLCDNFEFDPSRFSNWRMPVLHGFSNSHAHDLYGRYMGYLYARTCKFMNNEFLAISEGPEYGKPSRIRVLKMTKDLNEYTESLSIVGGDDSNDTAAFDACIITRSLDGVDSASVTLKGQVLELNENGSVSYDRTITVGVLGDNLNNIKNWVNSLPGWSMTINEGVPIDTYASRIKDVNELDAYNTNAQLQYLPAPFDVHLFARNEQLICVYTIWGRGQAMPVWMRSTSDGITWTEPVKIYPFDDNDDRNQLELPGVTLSNGDVLLPYHVPGNDIHILCLPAGADLSLGWYRIDTNITNQAYNEPTIIELQDGKLLMAARAPTYTAMAVWDPNDYIGDLYQNWNGPWSGEPGMDDLDGGGSALDRPVFYNGEHPVLLATGGSTVYMVHSEKMFSREISGREKPVLWYTNDPFGDITTWNKGPTLIANNGGNVDYGQLVVDQTGLRFVTPVLMDLVYLRDRTFKANKPSPDCLNPPSMDSNGDCIVDFSDFAIFSQQWLSSGHENPSQ